MAGNIGRDILVRLRLNDSDFRSKLEADGTLTRNFATSGGSVLSGLKANWFALTAAITGTAYAISRVIKPAAEWETQQSRLRIVAQGNIDDFERMRAIVDANSGGLFKKEDVAAAVTYADALGMELSQTEKLIPAVRNLAALYGMDLQAAMETILMAVQTGTVMGAKRLGILLDEKHLLETSMALYGKKVAQLTLEEAVTVRLTSAMEQMARFQNGEAEASRTMAGAMRALKVETDEFLETIATPALEPLTELVRLLTAGAKEARTFSERLAEMRANKGGGFVGAIDQAVAEQMGGGIPGALYALKDVLAKPDIQALLDQFGGYTGTAAGVYTPSGGLLSPGTKHGYQSAGETAYDLWLKGFLEKAAKDDQIAQFMERYAREQVGPAWGAEPSIVGGYEPGLADGDALKDMIVEQAKVRQAIAIEDEDRQNEIWRNGLETRLELQQTLGNAMAAGWEATYATMNAAGELFWSKEYRRGKSLTRLAKYVAKETLAAVVEGLGQEAKEQARVSFIMAAGFAARGMWGAAAQMSWVGAQWAAYAGTTAVAAAAIRGGASRELAAAGAERERTPGQITAAGGESSAVSRSVTGQLSASIARAPETVNINVTNVFEGPNVVGADASALRAFYDDHIRQWVADDQRANVLEAA